MKAQSSLKLQADNKTLIIPGIGTGGVPEFEPLAAGTQHAALAGTASDSNWATTALTPFYDDCGSALGMLADAVAKANDGSLDDFKPEVRAQKQAALLNEAVGLLERNIQRQREASEKGQLFAQHLLDAAVTPEVPRSEIEALRRDLWGKEVRDTLTAATPAMRKALIDRAVRERDVLFLAEADRALVELFPSDSHIIQRSRQEVGEALFPWLPRLVEHNAHVARAVEVRGQEAVGLAKQILTQGGHDFAQVKRLAAQPK